MKYALKPALDSDYNFCYRITKENMHELFCRHWGGWVDQNFQEGFILKNIHIITSNGNSVGFISIINENNRVYIDNIQIDKNFHNLCIGTSIIKEIIGYNLNKEIRLTTFIDNPAKRLYERLGFIIIDNTNGTLKMIKSAQQGDAPEPATNASPASQQSIPPAR